MINKPALAASLVWASLIAYFSLQPGGTVVRTGMWDKIEHLLGYLLLGALLHYALKRPVFAILTASLFGLLIEWGQSMIPDRVADLNDGIANALGAVIGVICTAVLIKWQDRNRS